VKQFVFSISWAVIAAFAYVLLPHFFGNIGIAIFAFLLLVYGVFAWKVKEIFGVVLWPRNEKNE
jgi:hypothetical protein